MPTNPRDLLLVAEGLCQLNCGTAQFRSAISRAYYAAFLVADLFLKQMALPVRNREQHKIVQERLEAGNDIPIKTAASRLALLRSRRKDADYKMSVRPEETADCAIRSIRMAGDIIRELDRCAIRSPRWVAIQAAIVAAGV
jgi:uncharacterized protein (UPF0332 family)